MTGIAALVLASALAPSPARDHAGTVASFLSALHGTVAPDTSSWTTRESMDDTALVEAGPLGTARLRNDDGKLLTWHLTTIEDSHNRRNPPSEYITEDEARQLATAFLERLSRTDLAIGEVRITRDHESALGEYVQGRVLVRLVVRNDPPFWGPHRRGVALRFDSADGKPLSFSEKDRVTTVHGESTVTDEQALRIANDYVRRHWYDKSGRVVRTTNAYCAAMGSLVDEIENGRNPLYRDTLTTYWCLVAHFDEPQGAWVAVRLTDGVVVWSALEP
ncbi:MAG: hypothetical protein AB7F50_10085 [Fimbriimonadaceae bacterium]